jgi:hypothetical protein
MTTSHPIRVSVGALQQPLQMATGRPVQLVTNGYSLRTLMPADADERMLAWLADPQMLRGLNLPPLIDRETWYDCPPSGGARSHR